MDSQDRQIYAGQDFESLNEEQKVSVAGTTEACEMGNLEAVSSAFNQLFSGEEPEYGHINSWLSRSISHGHADVVKFLLGKEVRPLHEFWAIYAVGIKDKADLVAVFEVLFDHGLKLEDIPEVINYATRNQPVLEYLLSKGADPNYVNVFGDVLLEHARPKIFRLNKWGYSIHLVMGGRELAEANVRKGIGSRLLPLPVLEFPTCSR